MCSQCVCLCVCVNLLQHTYTDSQPLRLSCQTSHPISLSQSQTKEELEAWMWSHPLLKEEVPPQSLEPNKEPF